VESGYTSLYDGCPYGAREVRLYGYMVIEAVGNVCIGIDRTGPDDETDELLYSERRVGNVTKPCM
jgi:hypothetical protein